MGVFKQFVTNWEAEKKGIAFRCSPNPDGTIPTLYLARTFRDSQEYRRVFERVTKPYKNEIDHGGIDPELDARLMQRVFAEVSVKDWENWRMPEGIAFGRGEGPEMHQDGLDPKRFDIPFSIEAVCATFHVAPELWRDAAATSTDADNYRIGNLEEIAKNY